MDRNLQRILDGSKTIAQLAMDEAAIEAMDKPPEVEPDTSFNFSFEELLSISKSDYPSIKNLKKDVKHHLQSHKKMRTSQYFLCDSCNIQIFSAKEGVIIRGNIYTANPDGRFGLIGNAFPDPDDDGKIKNEEILETVLCRKCLSKALSTVLSVNAETYGLNKPGERAKGVMARYKKESEIIDDQVFDQLLSAFR
jgi:hypothetical protein